MAWVCHNNPDIHIRCKFNGREQQLGSRRIRVDGWDENNQFQGCLFHGHENCEKTKGYTVNPLNNVPMSELKEKTKEISDYLSSLNVTLVEMYECEWEQLKKQRPEIKTFLKKEGLIQTPSPFQYPISKKDILEAVRKNKCFGFIQCDIHVPKRLRKKFSELQPIFKNTLVSRNDLSDLMRKYAEDNNLLAQLRRTLIGSYFGKKHSTYNPSVAMVFRTWIESHSH